MKDLRYVRSFVCTLMLGLTLCVAPVFADPIGPGFDLFATVPRTEVNLGAFGMVPLIGVPIGPGNTDTIVQRLAGTNFPDPGPSGTIPIELVALNLVGVAPITVGTDFYDLRVQSGFLLGLPANALGSMIVTHDVPDGGTFQSTLPVMAHLTFTPIGAAPPIAPVIVNDILLGRGAWSHTRPPGYPESATFPSGGFYPAVVPGTGGMRTTLTEEGQLAIHTVTPAVPEPSTLALLGTGGVGALLGRRRKRMVEAT